MLIAEAVGSVAAFALAALTWILHRRDSGGKLLGTALTALGVWFAALMTAQIIMPDPVAADSAGIEAYRLVTGLILASVSVVCGSFFGLCLKIGARSSSAILRVLGIVVAVEVTVVLMSSALPRIKGWTGSIEDGEVVPGSLFVLHTAFCFLLAIGAMLVLVSRWDAFDRVTKRRCAGIPVLIAAIIANEIGQYGMTPFLALLGLATAYLAQFRLGWGTQVQLGRSLVADQLADPMIVVDNDGQVVDANHQARKLFGWVGSPRSIADVLGEDFQLNEQHDSLVTLNRSGGHIDMIVRSTRVTHREDLLGWAVTLRDIDSLVYRQNDPAGDYRMLRRRRGDQRTGSENLAVLMRHDPLTAASNRIAFESVLEAAVASSRKDGNGLQVLMLDIDRFKTINDQHGHLAGDVILREVVDRVAGFIRANEMIARFGGDEFVLLLRRSSADAARATAEAMCAMVAASPVMADAELDVTVSIGVAGFSGDGAENGASLLAAADQSMYRVKRAGGNGVGWGSDVFASG